MSKARLQQLEAGLHGQDSAAVAWRNRLTTAEYAAYMQEYERLQAEQKQAENDALTAVFDQKMAARKAAREEAGREAREAQERQNEAALERGRRDLERAADPVEQEKIRRAYFPKF